MAEPSPRDSMPAIGLAAAIIERRDPDAVIGSFAADHVIRHEPRVPGRGHGGRRRRPHRPDRHHRHHADLPVDGVRLHPQGASLSVDGAPQARAVAEFVEKPDESTARELPRGGRVLVERGHVRRQGVGPARHPRPVPPRPRRRAAGHRGRPGRLDAGLGGAWRRSPSTTRSPNPPPPTAWSRSSRPPSRGTTSATSRRSARWSGRGRTPADGVTVIGDPADVISVAPRGWWPPAAAVWSPSSAWTTSSSSTPRTRCWSSPATGRRTSRSVVDRLKASGREDLT